MLVSLLEKHISHKMGKEIGLPQKGPNIRPADASVFKKAPGERGYNALVKSQTSAQNLMGGERAISAADLEGPRPDRPAYTEQTLATIKGCLDISEKNLQREDVISYLVGTFGEEQAQQILQDRARLQQELVAQYNSIIKSPDQPKEKA
jgi:hypothetical protein